MPKGYGKKKIVSKPKANTKPASKPTMKSYSSKKKK
tara:strand:+ start:201 stop:308 length:108 start_codon:yes stop_codon:yes gene_type:complete